MVRRHQNQNQKTERAETNYARKGYEFLVQRMALRLSWAAFGYRGDHAP